MFLNTPKLATQTRFDLFDCQLKYTYKIIILTAEDADICIYGLIWSIYTDYSLQTGPRGRREEDHLLRVELSWVWQGLHQQRRTSIALTAQQETFLLLPPFSKYYKDRLYLGVKQRIINVRTSHPLILQDWSKKDDRYRMEEAIVIIVLFVQQSQIDGLSFIINNNNHNDNQSKFLSFSISIFITSQPITLQRYYKFRLILIHQLVLIIFLQTMIRKGLSKNNHKFDRIAEFDQIEVPHQPSAFLPPIKNRLSLGSVLTVQTPRRNAVSLLDLQEQSIKQKQNLIKQLQQQITLKKQQNDAVQEAFRTRQQFTVFFDKTEQPVKRMRSIALGVSLLATYNKAFKMALLKQLKIVFREWRTNKYKAVKILLLWIVGWINKLFNMLGRNLTI